MIAFNTCTYCESMLHLYKYNCYLLHVQTATLFWPILYVYMIGSVAQELSINAFKNQMATIKDMQLWFGKSVCDLTLDPITYILDLIS